MKTEIQTSVIKKTLLLALLVATSSAWAEWVKMGASDGITFYVDPTTLRKDGSLRKVWELYDFKQPEKNGAMSFRVRAEYDCKEERQRKLAYRYHPEPMAQGASFNKLDGAGKWTEIVPGSFADTHLKRICNR